MNRLLKIASGVLIAVLALVAGLMYYLGGFLSITIHETKSGPFHFIYKEMRGSDMSQVGIITNDLHDILAQKGIVNLRAFDVYYPDDRAEIGFAVDVDDFEKCGSDTAFAGKILAAQQFMTTSFPYKNVMSYMVGFMKVSPALDDYRMQRGYRKTWAATLHEGDTITYLQPIEEVGR